MRYRIRPLASFTVTNHTPGWIGLVVAVIELIALVVVGTGVAATVGTWKVAEKPADYLPGPLILLAGLGLAYFGYWLA